MKIGLLQTGRSPAKLCAQYGDYNDMFKRLLADGGFKFKTYAVLDGVFPTNIKSAEGWLITGSKHAVYESHTWIAPLENFIRAAYNAAYPMVGVCFGHQIIAQALGGKVIKHPDGLVMGRHIYRNTNGDKIALLAWHQDQVVRLPPDGRVLAANAGCKYAMINYKNTIITCQPHPEFSRDFIKELANVRYQKNAKDAQIRHMHQNLNQPIEADKMANRFAELFTENQKTAFY